MTGLGTDFSFTAQVQLYNYTDMYDIDVFLSDVFIFATNSKRLKVRAAVAWGDVSQLT